MVLPQNTALSIGVRMSAVKLPRVIEEKLAELASQVRRLWLIRGLSRFALVFFVLALAAVLIDAKLNLSGAVRGLLLCSWMTILGFAAWRFIVRPLRNEVPVSMLAAAIEKHYPSLAERLSTLVELSEHSDAGNGSKALMEVLAKDTAQRTKKLNFFRAAPTGSVLRIGTVAVAVTLLVLSPMFFLPGSTERVRRFLLPWYAPRIEPSFKITVSSGDPIVKRGESVTLTGFFEPLKANVVLPETAVLLHREPGTDIEKKLPMTGDDKAAFTVTKPAVTSSFEYCIEAGDTRSEWGLVTVVDPVELIEGTSFTIQPPAYAKPLYAELVQQGLHEFEALQYSKVRFDMKFNRAATSASFEWTPANPEAKGGTEQFFAKLNADKTGGTAEWQLIAEGTLKLILVGEQNVRTEITMASKAILDAPPKFEKVTNASEKPKDVRPGERVVIDLAVLDDIRVATVELEYALSGENKLRTLPIVLKDLGTPRAEGRYGFDLMDKGKEGDTIQYRIRAFDNRSVPEAGIGPQSVVYPEKGWAVIRIDSTAKPLAQQDVLDKRDKIKEKLQTALKDAIDADNDVQSVKKEALGKPNLSADQLAKLENARNKAKDVARQLEELARVVGLTPELRGLAKEIRDVADSPLQRADDMLRKAQNEPAPQPRDKNIVEAAAKLDEAVEKLNALIANNDKLAQNRLDKTKLEEIADKQKELAEELKKNPDNLQATNDATKKQQDLNADLKDVVKGNDTLKKALDGLENEEANRLAEEAKKLADKQKDLDRASDELDANAKRKALEEAAKKQKEISDKADKLAKKTERPAQVADADALDKKPFDKAADALGKNDAVEAMTEQEKAARELERLAEALERAVSNRKDPKESAKQLAKLEEQLRKRTAEATKDQPFDKLPENLQKQMQGEQDAVRRATEKLTTPPGNEAATQAKKEALDQLQKAKKAMADNPAKADEEMAKAVEALQNLADKLPSRAERLSAARDELQKLERERAALERDVEEKLKGFEKKNPDEAVRKEAADKLADAAKKQAELAEKIDRLDTPGLESRREKTSKAAGQAADDLAKGRTQDIPATQRDTKRQMDRLKQAIDGQTPDDELADELAKKQKAIADKVQKADGKPDANAQQDLQEMERDVAKRLGGIKDAQDADQLTRAKSATQSAEEAIRKNDPAELKKKTADAARELDKLADKLAGVEPDANRAERLAAERQERADQAKKNAGKPTTPEETAAAQEELQRQADDLKNTRAGDAQEAKKNAADALEKLKKNPNPERAQGLQKNAADAMKQFADKLNEDADPMAKNERGNPDDKPQPGEDADGALPSKADAQAAHDLAKEQRENRERLSKANEQAAKGTKPTDNAELDKLAKEQQAIADQAAELAKQPGQGQEAADVAQKAADQLKAGAPERAQADGAKAEKQLDAAAKIGGDTPNGKKSKELAEKQKALNGEMAKQADNAGAAAAQQQARQKELAKEAGDLAEQFDKAAKQPKDDAKKTDPESSKKAAEAAKEAQQQMERAGRENEAGRKPNADDAREKATDAMERAKEHAQKAAGKKPGEGPADKPAQEAGKAAKQAEGEMDKAGKQLGKKNNAEAAKAMDKASEQVNKAAEKLAESGDSKGEGGKPEPGKGETGKEPGGNDGSAQAPVTKADLPADLAQYAGKPWGELPGDVKSKIIQDLKAKYGEDYARVIKLYFEQLAERK